MRNTPRSGLVRSLALVLAMIGAMFVAAPQGAQAAPAMVSTEVAAPAAGLTQVQYGGHWRGHGGHRGRHFGHHRGHHYGRHFGHHRGHHFGRHFGHHRGHHHGYGRRHFY